MRTLFFWTAWFLVSAWVLKTFYFSAKEKHIRRLRRTAFGINFLALILFFLPWLPTAGETGWELIMAGRGLVILVFGAVLLSAVLLFLSSSAANKAGAGLEGASAMLFIIMMVRLSPGTFALNANSIAPIIASLLLIINFVVVLLLWQQLQLKERKS